MLKTCHHRLHTMTKQKLIIMTYAKLFLAASLLVVSFSGAIAQVVFEGHITDKNTSAALGQVQVSVWDDMLKKEIAHTYTDVNGFYTVTAPRAVRYSIHTDKATYFEQDTVMAELKGAYKTDLMLNRKPGYVFDITIFDKAYEHNPINTLRDCKIEIYNNTTGEQELTIEKSPKSTFNFAFAEGNHYTMLVRKPGYLNRRVELYVNINGCILCVDGMGVKEPDLVQVMSHNNEIGHFLGTLDLDSVQVGTRFALKNIYYDYDKWNIRPEAGKVLDKLAIFLKDNPGIKVELGSHTDARGKDPYNLTLSDKRAAAAVEYLVASHGIDSENITSKGYGETQLINACTNGVKCEEEAHQMNRRTEIKITGYSEKDPLWEKSLKEIIEDKELYKKIINQGKQAKTFTAKYQPKP
jgi:outer membrane protein OmpA-like peptidoglycan-associated protein